jgi:hypothetical protein
VTPDFSPLAGHSERSELLTEKFSQEVRTKSAMRKESICLGSVTENFSQVPRFRFGLTILSPIKSRIQFFIESALLIPCLPQAGAIRNPDLEPPNVLGMTSSGLLSIVVFRL